MSDSKANSKLPSVMIALELAPALARALELGTGQRESVRGRLAAELAQLLDILGIPGDPEVQLTAPIFEGNAGWRLVRVVVNGQLCLYNRELLESVYRYVKRLGPEVSSAPVYLRGDDFWQSEGETGSLVEFLSLAALEIIKTQPSILLGMEQLTPYIKSLGDAVAWEEGAAQALEANVRLHDVLSSVLDMRISIADREKVARALQEGLAADRSTEDIGEALITALAPEVVELRLPQADLKELTIDDQGTGSKGFTTCRDELFYKLGMKYPRFHFVIDENLKPQSFAFKINHLTTTPQKGLPPGRCLVEDPSNLLSSLGIKYEPAVSQRYGRPVSTIGISDQDIAEAAGLTVWGQMRYLAMRLGTELRNHSSSLLHVGSVQAELKRLELAFPALLNSARLKISDARLTRVLRALVTEGLPVRNLKFILEQVIEFDYIIIDPLRYIVFDPRLAVSAPPTEYWLSKPETMAAFARVGMKRYISYKYTQGSMTLLAYLLDKEVEEALSVDATTDDRWELKRELDRGRCLDILQAVRAKIDGQLPAANPPVILTSWSVRSAVRELVAPEFPQLPVLSYEELTPEVSVIPIDRIWLHTEDS